MGIQIISFHCVLKNRLGQLISSTFNHDVITHGSGPEDMLHALAQGLMDIRKGEKRRIALRADEAYGFYEPDQVISRAREELPNGDRLRVGDQLKLEVAPGKRKLFRVIESSSEQVILDGNHPLAGQDLIFEIEALDAREATPDEIWESQTLPSTKTWH